MELVPMNKVFDITLDYIANDPEVKEFTVYIQSEEFPMIHKTVEYLKQYKDVSAFICTYLKHKSDSKTSAQFQNVADLLFSSVCSSSMIMVLTFMQSSMKCITSLTYLHSNQQIPHAWVSVFTGSLMM